MRKTTKKRPTDATLRNIRAAHTRDEIIDRRIAEITKRLDVIESLIDRGLGKFRKD